MGWARADAAAPWVQAEIVVTSASVHVLTGNDDDSRHLPISWIVGVVEIGESSGGIQILEVAVDVGPTVFLAVDTDTRDALVEACVRHRAEQEARLRHAQATATDGPAPKTLWEAPSGGGTEDSPPVFGTSPSAANEAPTPKSETGPDGRSGLDGATWLRVALALIAAIPGRFTTATGSTGRVTQNLARSDRTIWLPTVLAVVAAISVLLPWVTIQAAILAFSAAPYRSWQGWTFMAGMVGAATVSFLVAPSAPWRTPTLCGLFGAALGLTLGLLLRVLSWSGGTVNVGPEIGLLVALIATSVAFVVVMSPGRGASVTAIRVGICAVILGGVVVFAATAEVGPALNETNDDLDALFDGNALFGGEDSTTEPADDESGGSTGVAEWVSANPAVGSAIDRVSGLMLDISSAVDRADWSEVQLLCRDLGVEARSLERFSGAGQPERWDDALFHLDETAAACLEGDFEESGRQANNVGSDFNAMSAQLDAER